MFDSRDKHLAELEIAYTAFMETVRNLSPENFLSFKRLNRSFAKVLEHSLRSHGFFNVFLFITL
jgi:hypothetical protein